VGDIDFMSDPWPTISSGAKDLIKKILIQDPKKRVSILDVLSKCFSLGGTFCFRPLSHNCIEANMQVS
jgi:hypothetical protein